MSTKHECDCTHGKGEHSTRNNGLGTIYTHCRVVNCKCKKYKFLKFVESFTRRKTKRARKGVLKISDLGPNGKVRT